MIDRLVGDFVQPLYQAPTKEYMGSMLPDISDYLIEEGEVTDAMVEVQVRPYNIYTWNKGTLQDSIMTMVATNFMRSVECDLPANVRILIKFESTSTFGGIRQYSEYIDVVFYLKFRSKDDAMLFKLTERA